ncbi:DUF1752-domain-containing protein [Hesseltinella vesiculosa]|uniref:DUF1752-domain-containing protein n=1 Tax=Hesseltinella vesiculosa TaxID=101127 RepID=A0A1X2G806_9FUNG|nr:DUF1752-domain-containing protein [Hesseltinella vesiculosa]
MAQAVDIPVLSLIKESPITTEDLTSMWHVFSKCKNNLENGRRLENLSWRLWYRESIHRDTQSTSFSSSASTFGPSTPANSVASKPSAYTHFLPLTPCSHTSPPSHVTPSQATVSSPITFMSQPLLPLPSPAASPLPPRSCITHDSLDDHPSKFYVDTTDDEPDENDDGDDDDLWSTVGSHEDGGQILFQAQKRNFKLAPPSFQKRKPALRRLVEKKKRAPVIGGPSLLSSLLKEHGHLPPIPCSRQPSTSPLDELPASLQSCVDWEQAQNRRPCNRLGDSPFFPSDDMVW